MKSRLLTMGLSSFAWTGIAREGEGAGGAGGGDPAAAAAAAEGAGGAGTTDWTTTLDPDLRAAVGTKGYKTPADVTKAYFELEKTVGLDKLPLPAKDKDGKQDFSKWDGWNKLGRPETADKYDVKAAKLPDGVTLDEARLKPVLPRLHAVGLTQTQMAEVLAIHGEEMAALRSGVTAQAEERAAKAHETLQKDWGAAYEANVALAARGIKEFGGEALLTSLKQNGLLGQDGAVLDPTIAKAFADIGRKLAGETGGLGEPKDTVTATMTPADAQKEHAAMIAATFAAQTKNESHPGWDRRHPEYKAYQEKVQRLLNMGWPADTKETQASAA